MKKCCLVEFIRVMKSYYYLEIAVDVLMGVFFS